ncbi:MAG: hypothetical protein AB8B71_15435 [Paracoccaceae bacterium]
MNGKLRVLPALLRHMRAHLFIFQKTRSSIPGRELAFQFETTIGQIIEAEIVASRYARTLRRDQIVFLLGGLFAMLQDWREHKCEDPNDLMLERLDAAADQILKGIPET